MATADSTASNAFATWAKFGKSIKRYDVPRDLLAIAERLNESTDGDRWATLRAELYRDIPEQAGALYAGAQEFFGPVAGWALDPRSTVPILTASGEKARRRFPVVSAAEIEKWPPPPYLVRDVLPERAFGVFSGGPDSFKSFIVLDMALSVASGLPWCGHPVRQGLVVYVAMEGSSGLGKRVAAWRIARRMDAPADLLFVPTTVGLSAPTDAAEFIGFLLELPKKPVLVVLDTFARGVQPGDENSTRDVGGVVAAVDRIRELGAAVVAVHHLAKASGALRGSGALLGALDVHVEAKADRERRRLILTCGKAKDGPPFEPIHLAGRVIDLPSGETSLVFDVAEGGGVEALVTIGEQHRRLLDVLRGFGPEGATATDWQQAAERKEISRTSFFRGKKELEELRRVESAGSGKGARWVLVGEGISTRLVPNGTNGTNETGPQIGTKVPTPRRGGTLEPMAGLEDESEAAA